MAFSGSGYGNSGEGYGPSGGHSDLSGHSGFRQDKCCPLVVDPLCVAAILLAIAGATVLLLRLFTIELCRIMGVVINEPCPNPGGRKKRSIEYLMLEGKSSAPLP